MSKSIQNTSNLEYLWKNNKSNFFEWVRAFSDAAHPYTLERVARDVGANPAEVEAVIQLSQLGDEELKLLSDSPPPKTTWFRLADMSSEEIKVALVALNKRAIGQTPSSVLDNLLGVIDVTTRLDEVKKLSSEIFKHLSARAKRYGLLKENERAVLFSFAKKREKGEYLSDKQAVWAVSMMERMLQSDALKTRDDEPEADIQICRTISELFTNTTS